MQIDRYSGKGLGPGKKNRYPYLADKPLVDAVNMAIVLRRPLLVKGQPGCGKTRLAGSIAHELGLPLREWHVKSTSRARDGLYSIDMVRRLQDAATKNPKAQRMGPYVRFGALGEALRSKTESVLLIDEIDKADIDFPKFDKAKRLTDLPHWQVLFKHQQDLKRLQQREREGEARP